MMISFLVVGLWSILRNGSVLACGELQGRKGGGVEAILTRFLAAIAAKGGEAVEARVRIE